MTLEISRAAAPAVSAVDPDLVRLAVAATGQLRRSRQLMPRGDQRQVLTLRVGLQNILTVLDGLDRGDTRLLIQALRVHVAGLSSLYAAMESSRAAGMGFQHFLDVPRLRQSCERQAGAALHYALVWCRKLGVPAEACEVAE